jgi:hypothetical protein
MNVFSAQNRAILLIVEDSLLVHSASEQAIIGYIGLSIQLFLQLRQPIAKLDTRQLSIASSSLASVYWHKDCG